MIRPHLEGLGFSPGAMAQIGGGGSRGDAGGRPGRSGGEAGPDLVKGRWPRRGRSVVGLGGVNASEERDEALIQVSEAEAQDLAGGADGFR